MPSWASLPAEVRGMILQLLTRHSRRALYATISREWQHTIEKSTFCRLKLNQSRLDDFEPLNSRRQGLVRHVCLNLELQKYTCRICQQWESETWTHDNNKIIMAAISKLFSIISTWDPTKEGLALELNAYSLSDSGHWLKHCYFDAFGEEDSLDVGTPLRNSDPIHNPSHGWEHGERAFPIKSDAIRRIHASVYLKFRPELPQVKAVTKFILRRQCRRQWAPPTLWQIWEKLPRLEDIVYEPWQLYAMDTPLVKRDPEYARTMTEHLPEHLKKLSVFEDFNETYLSIFKVDSGFLYADLSQLPPYNRRDHMRITTPQVGAAFAAGSLGLEHLSVSFMVDAMFFFEAFQPQWKWYKLESLSLTSRLMSPGSDYNEIAGMLRDAGQVALSMPRLKTMNLWNGAKGEACAFIYCRQDASIAWRGTWEFKLPYWVLSAWKKVTDKFTRKELRVDLELLDCEIRSHGDAIHHLKLTSVVDSVSLQQIRKENASDVLSN